MLLDLENMPRLSYDNSCDNAYDNEYVSLPVREADHHRRGLAVRGPAHARDVSRDLHVRAGRDAGARTGVVDSSRILIMAPGLEVHMCTLLQILLFEYCTLSDTYYYLIIRRSDSRNTERQLFRYFRVMVLATGVYAGGPRRCLQRRGTDLYCHWCNVQITCGHARACSRGGGWGSSGESSVREKV